MSNVTNNEQLFCDWSAEEVAFVFGCEQEEEVFTSKKTHKLYDEDMVGAAKSRAIAIMQAEGPIWGKYGFSWEEWTDEVGKGIDWLVTPDGIVVSIDMLFPF